MKPDKVNQKRKFIRKWNEFRWKNNRRTTYVELDVHIQRGWVREYRLTEYGKRRPDAHILEEILKAVNRPQYCSNRDFKLSKSQRRAKKDKSTHYHIWPLSYISEVVWIRLKHSEKGWDKYFRRETAFIQHERSFTPVRVFRNNGVFELHVRRNWITKLPLLDPAKMSDDAKYYTRMEQNLGEFNKALNWYKRGKYDKERHSLIEKKAEDITTSQLTSS